MPYAPGSDRFKLGREPLKHAKLARKKAKHERKKAFKEAVVKAKVEAIEARALNSRSDKSPLPDRDAYLFALATQIFRLNEQFSMSPSKGLALALNKFRDAMTQAHRLGSLAPERYDHVRIHLQRGTNLSSAPSTSFAALMNHHFSRRKHPNLTVGEVVLIANALIPVYGTVLTGKVMTDREKRSYFNLKITGADYNELYYSDNFAKLFLTLLIATQGLLLSIFSLHNKQAWNSPSFSSLMILWSYTLLRNESYSLTPLAALDDRKNFVQKQYNIFMASLDLANTEKLNPNMYPELAQGIFPALADMHHWVREHALIVQIPSVLAFSMLPCKLGMPGLIFSANEMALDLAENGNPFNPSHRRQHTHFSKKIIGFDLFIFLLSYRYAADSEFLQSQFPDVATSSSQTVLRMFYSNLFATAVTTATRTGLLFAGPQIHRTRAHYSASFSYVTDRASSVTQSVLGWLRPQASGAASEPSKTAHSGPAPSI